MVDVILALDFGYPSSPYLHSSIDDIAHATIMEMGRPDISGLIVLAQDAVFEQIARYLGAIPKGSIFRPEEHTRIWKIATGQSTTSGQLATDSDSANSVSSGTSWDFFKAVKEKLAALGITAEHVSSITVVTHELLLSRALEQASKIGLRDHNGHVPVAPTACKPPSKTYLCATQWWCRHPCLWYLRELPGRAVLRQRGEL